MICIVSSPTTIEAYTGGKDDEENFLQLDGNIVFGPWKGKRKFKILLEDNQIIGFEDNGNTCLECSGDFSWGFEEVRGRKLCLHCAVKELKELVERLS